MATHLTLVRHGTTEWMEKGTTHGRMDAPLSQTGLQQVKGAADLLRGRKFDGFFCSPTGRTRQTAGIIAAAIGHQPEPLDLLMEQDFGIAEGTSLHYFPMRLRPFHLMVNWLFPHFKGGETLREVHKRAVKALDLMLAQEPGGTILVVSHYGLITMILREITGQKFRFFFLPPASITEIEVEKNRKGKIVAIAEIPSGSERTYSRQILK